MFMHSLSTNAHPSIAVKPRSLGARLTLSVRKDGPLFPIRSTAEHLPSVQVKRHDEEGPKRSVSSSPRPL